MDSARQIFWNINGKLPFYILLAFSLAVFVIGFYKRVNPWRLGGKVQSGSHSQRMKPLWNLVFRNKGNLRGNQPRAAHLCIFYGFLFLGIGAGIIAAEKHFNLGLKSDQIYLITKLILDLAGLVILVGLALTAYKRYIKKPERLENSFQDGFILALVFGIIITGFMLEGLRLLAAGAGGSIWYPVGTLLFMVGGILGLAEEQVRSMHQALWYVHMTGALVFIASVPYTRLFHFFSAPLSYYFRSLEPKGALPSMDVPKAGTPGANRRLIGDVVTEKELWSCTTCGICEDRCPMLLEHVSRIVDMRRDLVLNAGEYPAELAGTFSNLDLYGNPWGDQSKERDSWSKELNVPTLDEVKQADVLYWVGCYGSHNPRSVQVSAAVVSILRKAGIDFAILGNRERCCGDAARRLGNETLFQKLARENIEILRAVEAKKILTSCPHCFNTSIHSLAGNFRSYITHPLSMKQSHAKSLCYGYGGGRAWLNGQAAGINVLRSQQALKTGREAVITSCPLCLNSLTAGFDGMSSKNKPVCLDLAEFVERSL